MTASRNVLAPFRLANCTRRTRPKNHPAPPCTTTPRYPCTVRNLLPSPHHQCQIQANTVFHPASMSSSSPPLPRQPIRPTRRDAKSFAFARFSRRNESIAETCVQPASISDAHHFVRLSRRRVCIIPRIDCQHRYASHVSVHMVHTKIQKNLKARRTR